MPKREILFCEAKREDTLGDLDFDGRITPVYRKKGKPSVSRAVR